MPKRTHDFCFRKSGIYVTLAMCVISTKLCVLCYNIGGPCGVSILEYPQVHCNESSFLWWSDGHLENNGTEADMFIISRELIKDHDWYSANPFKRVTYDDADNVFSAFLTNGDGILLHADVKYEERFSIIFRPAVSMLKVSLRFGGIMIGKFHAVMEQWNSQDDDNLLGYCNVYYARKGSSYYIRTQRIYNGTGESVQFIGMCPNITSVNSLSLYGVGGEEECHTTLLRKNLQFSIFYITELNISACSVEQTPTYPLSPTLKEGEACRPEDTCAGHYYCLNNTPVCRSGFYGERCTQRSLLGVTSSLRYDDQCFCCFWYNNVYCMNNGTCWEGKCCCPENYTGYFCQFPPPHIFQTWTVLNNVSYFIPSQLVEVQRANNYCESHQATLAVVHDKTNQINLLQAIKDHTAQHDYLVIGLRKMFNESIFSSARGNELTYTNWNDVNDSTKIGCFYVKINVHTGKWFLHNCEDSTPMLIACQRQGWTSPGIDEFDYFVPSGRFSHYESKSVCEAYGGFVATIFTKESNDFLAMELFPIVVPQTTDFLENFTKPINATAQKGFWIGLHSSPFTQLYTSDYNTIIRKKFLWFSEHDYSFENWREDFMPVTVKKLHRGMPFHVFGPLDQPKAKVPATHCLAAYVQQSDGKWKPIVCNVKRHALCQRYSDPCRQNSCALGSTCIPNMNNHTYSCMCSSQQKGTLCDRKRFCHISRCAYSRPCIELENDFRCDCGQGFTGMFCSSDLDECETLGACPETSSCVNTIGSFSCQCLDGMTGSRCDVNIDVGSFEGSACDGQPCSNDGTCFINGTGFSCQCLPGFFGKTCSRRLPNDDTLSVLEISAIILFIVSILSISTSLLVVWRCYVLGRFETSSSSKGRTHLRVDNKTLSRTVSSPQNSSTLQSSLERNITSSDSPGGYHLQKKPRLPITATWDASSVDVMTARNIVFTRDFQTPDASERSNLTLQTDTFSIVDYLQKLGETEEEMSEEELEYLVQALEDEKEQNLMLGDAALQKVTEIETHLKDLRKRPRKRKHHASST